MRRRRSSKQACAKVRLPASPWSPDRARQRLVRPVGEPIECNCFSFNIRSGGEDSAPVRPCPDTGRVSGRIRVAAYVAAQVAAHVASSKASLLKSCLDSEGALPAGESWLNNKVQTLYSEHHGWLYGWLHRRLGDAFVAADLAQDAFVSVMAAGAAQDIREPRPFLATLARRLMAHRHRRQSLEAAYLDLLAAAPEVLAPSPEVHYLALEALRQVDEALQGLPSRVREAFLLAHLDGASYSEIADRLGVSTSSVKQYLSRANQHCLFALEA